MELVIVKVYQAFAKITSLPASFFIGSRLVDYGITMLIFMIGLGLLIAAMPKSYKAPLKHLFGWGFGLLLLGFNGMNCANVIPETIFHRYTIYGMGFFTLLMVMFLVENIIIGWTNGVNTILLWFGDWFLTMFAMRLWYQYSDMGRSQFDYTRLYPLARVLDKYKSFMVNHNFTSLIFIGEWLCILGLLAFCGVILSNVNKLIPGDYKVISKALVMGTFIYMVFLAHDGYLWSAFYNSVVYGIAAVAQCSLLFLMVFVPKAIIGGKDVKPIMIIKRAMAMIQSLLVGVCLNMSALFAHDIVNTGSIKKVLDPMSEGMTWMYRQLRELNFGYRTNFLSTPFRVSVGFFVATFLIYLVVLFMFFLMKIAMGDLKCEGMTLPWLRNCVLILVVPVGLYWFYSMCSNSLGDTGLWISSLAEISVLIGALNLIGNFVSAVKKKNTMSLVKWTLVSMVVCLLVVFTLLPLLMIFA